MERESMDRILSEQVKTRDLTRIDGVKHQGCFRARGDIALDMVGPVPITSEGRSTYRGLVNRNKIDWCIMGDRPNVLGAIQIPKDDATVL